jgi:putative addiction module killer protein
MELKKKVLKIYQDANGREPFVDWLESIKDRTTRHRIITRLDRVESGNLGDFKPVGNGVFELILQFGPGYRVYFGNDGDILVILLMGGDKITQENDIKKALAYWKDYKECKNERF